MSLFPKKGGGWRGVGERGEQRKTFSVRRQFLSGDGEVVPHLSMGTPC